ncbi:MAG TPA: prepilin-type N-terminal cleavage/methylation domain-containing protein [Gammaproteobacteria bacterium]|nr:prepilin-type N-terminal cleavage/methylation domain-containing protein [Gammaproteobacteria bacterium]
MKKNRIHYRQSSNMSQKGFTMVELLVAMAIGLFLISGVFQLFIANKQSSRIQDNLSHVQENGRFAISEIGRVLRMTGIKSDPVDTTTFVTSAAISGVDNGGLGADEIFVSFQGAVGTATAGGVVDCLGTKFLAALPATTITNRFYLANDANGVSSLFCVETTAAVLDPQPLVENVVDMQITYGVDTNNSGTANYYVDATTVTTGTAGVPDWTKVVSVNLNLLVASGEDNVTTTAQTYKFNGASVSAGDNRLYKAFSITVALRNLLG